MPTKDRKPVPPAEVTVAIAEAVPVPDPALPEKPPQRPSEALAIGNPAPAMVEPETLVLGLRSLQQRIPGFTQLSIDEVRSMARAAYLDPEFVDAGIHLAHVWDRTNAVIGRDPSELREDADETRRWDEAEREAMALIKGMGASNLERKHRLGQDILAIYSLVGRLLRHPNGDHAHLRPYYEEMQRLYRKNMQKPGKGKKKEPKTGE